MSATRGGAGRVLAIAASVVVVATVATALMVMDPPAKQRDMRIDERREDDLMRIETLAREHLKAHDALPADLAALAARPGLAVAVADPVDGSAYGYEVTGPRSLRLCANFATDTSDRGGKRHVRSAWAHPAGHHCFDRRFEKPSRADD
ncbi:hypothetical protein [Marilutibacter maris]|uniref:Type II secretion system protein n=1 Tax=Marilutibacter maris TaxID=1605891 RepID=A0A2U9T3Y9_9GAMM|nr:hypothetical protein [Lysobacter maris]AWV06272.1 hypothetical protein C9I47_0549 [Lysobacter maris]KAB8198376.1 hypothetical protein FKV24_002470 [Lysobacter maris]